MWISSTGAWLSGINPATPPNDAELSCHAHLCRPRSTRCLPGLPPESVEAQRIPGVFLCPVLGVGLPRVYQGNFFGEKPAGFSPFSLLSQRFSPCKGRYAPFMGGFLLISGDSPLEFGNYLPLG